MVISTNWFRRILVAALTMPALAMAATQSEAPEVQPVIDAAAASAPVMVDDCLPVAPDRCGRQCYAERIDTPSPVPEPDMYALMLVGVGMVAAAARRAVSVGANRTVSSSERHGGAKLPFNN
ncbi:PEP-CTERM sorting domain-containing protein [Massilia genomosp. 1]|uniref:PEP-CTERM sorting domain-containing protein n=1 Tax=Massilia genomosp. 1 TaxID=2609280 RepID=A0ABX0MYT2_9BURK|nr:PEP-CTERM sorting domain-containing protein [Massilia genomosp. 1]NHZ64429.1 PEP-CTERM sorting domain-containing protein [Massilia genomosp. 1]